jgi:hypothetical protein
LGAKKVMGTPAKPDHGGHDPRPERATAGHGVAAGHRAQGQAEGASVQLAGAYGRENGDQQRGRDEQRVLAAGTTLVFGPAQAMPMTAPIRMKRMRSLLRGARGGAMAAFVAAAAAGVAGRESAGWTAPVVVWSWVGVMTLTLETTGIDRNAVNRRPA